jgi:hypothetical protein
VKEEADSRTWQPPSKQLRQEQELVVVHPDAVALDVVLRHDVREALVHGFVRLPVALVHLEGRRLVVEDGPQDPVRQAIVVSLDVLAAERDGDEAACGELGLEPLAPYAGRWYGAAGPSDPRSVTACVQRCQPRREAAAARLEAQVTLRVTCGDGKAIRDDEEPAHGVETSWKVRGSSDLMVMPRC